MIIIVDDSPDVWRNKTTGRDWPNMLQIIKYDYFDNRHDDSDGALIFMADLLTKLHD